MNVVLFLVLFAVLQNVDNLVLATAYRLKNVLISRRPNLLIAVLSGIATGVPTLAATGLKAETVELGRNSVAELVGRGVLVMVGVWTVVGHFRSQWSHRFSKSDSDSGAMAALQGQLTLMQDPEAVMIGAALAVDNLAPSFAIGLIMSSSRSALILTALTAGCSIVAVACGQVLGRQGRTLFHRMPRVAIAPELVSGFLIIGIAVLPVQSDDLAKELLKRSFERTEK